MVTFVKIREFFISMVTVLVIFITLSLVIDLQMDYGYSGYRLKQYEHISYNKKVAPASSILQEDRFDDLKDVLKLLKLDKSKKSNVISDPGEYHEYNPTLGDVMNIEPEENNATSLFLFQLKISKYEMYKEGEPLLSEVINDMRYLKIISVEHKSGGTQPKLTMTLSNGAKALFKPMRMQRTQETDPNHYIFADYERHNAEIAGYHLDRLLGFRRGMPVTGRLLDITTEIRDVVVDEYISSNFFLSPPPANNTCFLTQAKQYADLEHPICGEGDKLEGSMAAYLPEFVELEHSRHPWRRTYRTNETAVWENDPEYCNTHVRNKSPTNNERLLLDFMDSSVLDFLSGNMDRHNYQTFSVFGKDSASIHYDNGRAFGRPFYDEMTILAPVIQCCLIRHSTLETLLRYHNGPSKLSEAMRVALADDPLAPVLWEPHLLALDRRIKIILQTIRHCRIKLD